MNSAVNKKDFWISRLEVNACSAIFHQWEQLEASGCIENFRIAAGEADGFREGWFFADSDAYKWLEAAARICAAHPDDRLAGLIDGLIALLSCAQMPDGYLFTYNQIHFPGTRWRNLQIEHELYCHGHLIEAGVSHYQVTGRRDLLEIARKAAGRIVADFQGKGPAYTPGHEEIEIALLRLHQVTPADQVYLNLARQFIEQRGRTPLYGLALLRQNSDVGRRGKYVQEQKARYLASHPGFQPYLLPPGNVSRKPRGTALRWNISALSGKYFQQHAPVRKQVAPVGHSVRFAYLATATAMLARETGDATLMPALEQAWERMVQRRMYVTGGIGSLPGLEGFGNDYELDPETAYSETCAALACLFWNWEMVQLTGEAKYTDLFEWQLYNAAAVGMGLDGATYLYNNPLACREGVERKSWYAVPCCPSNLSRTWADLEKYIYISGPDGFTVHQYISSELLNRPVMCEDAKIAALSLNMESELPWTGKVRLEIREIEYAGSVEPAPLEIRLRLPSWTSGMSVTINGHPEVVNAVPGAGSSSLPASGYDPVRALFVSLRRCWTAGDVIEINLKMPVLLRSAHPKVKHHHHQVAVTRGALVYCLESVDNPGLDIFAVRLDPGTLTPVFDPELLGGIVKLQANTRDGAPLTLIPYFLWGNRGPSQMTVWVNN